MTGNKVTLEQMRSVLNLETGVSKGKAKLLEDGKIEIYDSTLEALGKEVTDHAITNLKPTFVEALAKLTADEYATMEQKLQAEVNKTHEELIKLAESARPIEIKVDKKTTKLEGTHHSELPNLIKIVGANQPVLLVGPAGTGKTYAAEVTAKSLDLSFHSISVGSQTSKSDLWGYRTADGNYIETEFRKAYENGGLFLLDEADAGNSNVLILLNAALSNGYAAFPDKMVTRHKDFRIVATANTYGSGASRLYVGRNQLDAATLDRFAVLNWEIDPVVETMLAGKTDEGKRWLNVVRAVRKQAIEVDQLRVVISPRAVERGVKLFKAGLTFKDVLEIALLSNMPVTEQAGLRNIAQAAWTKGE